MVIEDFLQKNPLRVLNLDADGKAIDRRMGLVIARAGLGKSAILVQIALDSLLRRKRIVHVSIGQNFDKTKARYDDVYNDIVEAYNLENATAMRDETMRNRIIMTFNESVFSVPRLQERLNDLVDQDIFRPHGLVVDGFDFTPAEKEDLIGMRKLTKKVGLNVWFSAVCHRDDPRESENGVPAPCHEVDDLFDTIILLQPESREPDAGRPGNGKIIELNILKDTTGGTDSSRILNLDTETLMIIRE
ncbi:MAG: hypothetical protein U9O82_00900 [Thermodesulfobacteriota bacterium]|nr:hypothetical protein [Thermodesulfobacteriota bacterium]